MAGGPFMPLGNSVALAATTATQVVVMSNPTAPALVVTNEGTASAWITWDPTNTAVAAVFPVAGTPAFGMLVAAGAQVSLGTNGKAAYVAAILRSGTGTITFTAGDGL